MRFYGIMDEEKLLWNMISTDKELLQEIIYDCLEEDAYFEFCYEIENMWPEDILTNIDVISNNARMIWERMKWIYKDDVHIEELIGI